MGHSRSRHGLHSACSRTTRASGPVGPVVVSSVAPNTATVGTPERRGDVHCAGIVGQEEAAGGGQVDEFAQGGFAGEIADLDAAAPQRFGHRFAERPLAGRSE